MKKRLYAYNLALKREDGKVEQDTIFAEKKLTAVELEVIGNVHKCSCVASLVGYLSIASEEDVKSNSIVYMNSDLGHSDIVNEED